MQPGLWQRLANEQSRSLHTSTPAKQEEAAGSAAGWAAAGWAVGWAAGSAVGSEEAATAAAAAAAGGLEVVGLAAEG